MASLTIRKLDPAIKESLRVRAAKSGRSMEAEARRILQSALQNSEATREVDLAEAVRRRFAPLGGVDELAAHIPVVVREPPSLDS
ncbi:MAG TPA: plasmid stabilization protein [Methylocystis sp.]|nr:plasmid stabilization protein [Methylocystis sp.]